jgi:hypothetical protein
MFVKKRGGFEESSDRDADRKSPAIRRSFLIYRLGTAAVISDVQINVDCQQRTAVAATDIDV